MANFVEGSLFPDLEPEIIEVQEDYKRQWEAAKRRVNNLQLLSYPDFDVEGEEDMPKIPQYCGNLPADFIAFSRRGCKNCDSSYGIHCFEYDCRISSAWTNPLRPITVLKRYPCAIGPDFSLMVDQPRAVNVTNVYRNRWVSCFWWRNGIPVIPSASWGNAESFSWCFDGLPEGGVIAVGHIAIGRDKAAKRLYRMGVETLLERKHPDKLLVYGFPLDFEPGVDVVTYQGDLLRLRQL